jgi:hypothetical protein
MQSITKIQKIAQDISGQFDFSIDRKLETQYYHMQTQIIHIGFDGKRTGTETYYLKLRDIPAALSEKKLDQCTVKEFGLQLNSENIVTIPALKSWSYEFNRMSGVLDKGPVFGISHDKFEGIVDSKGNKISPEFCYAIYNNFIDFHALNDIFSRPLFGKGIDALKLIGDKIVHPAAFSEAPVNLGTTIKPGSVFRNGEITLEFKGVGIVDGAVCAIIGYDSGESTLKMAVKSSEEKYIETEGGSEYKGDIYMDLETGWVRKITLDEFVVTETEDGNNPAKIKSYTVRHLLLRLINQQGFEEDLNLHDDKR